eukprot:GHVQ01004900.1.p1 GENE.GHVQ01004900.1~~GHVQ01004900.1.p1  ORF type:complete len:472 (+),score=63.10 GHVQ01004900.1:637-2052(+)
MAGSRVSRSVPPNMSLTTIPASQLAAGIPPVSSATAPASLRIAHPTGRLMLHRPPLLTGVCAASHCVRFASATQAHSSPDPPRSSTIHRKTYFKSASHRAMVLNMVRLDLQNRLLCRYHLFGQMECRVLSSAAFRPVLTLWAEYLLQQNPACPLSAPPQHHLSGLHTAASSSPSTCSLTSSSSESSLASGDWHSRVDASVAPPPPPRTSPAVYSLQPPCAVLEMKEVQSLRKSDVEADWLLSRLARPPTEDCIPLPLYPSVLRLDLPQFPYNTIELNQMGDFYGLLKWPFKKRFKRLYAPREGLQEEGYSESKLWDRSVGGHGQAGSTVWNNKIEGLSAGRSSGCNVADTSVTGEDGRWRRRKQHGETIAGTTEDSDNPNFGFADVQLTDEEVGADLRDIDGEAVPIRRRSSFSEENRKEKQRKAEEVLRQLQRENASWRIVKTACDESSIYSPTETETGFYGSKDFWQMS